MVKWCSTISKKRVRILFIVPATFELPMIASLSFLKLIQQELVKELRRQKKKERRSSKRSSLGLYSLSAKRAEKIPNVKSYKIPEKAAGWVAYQLEEARPEKVKADTTKQSQKR